MESVKRFEIVNSYKDIGPLFKDLLAECAALGFEFASFAGIEDEEPAMLETGCPIIATSYPHEWAHRYAKREYYKTDPVVYLAPVSESTMDWGVVSALNSDFFNEASAFGLRAGLSIPIHVSHRLYLVSFATTRDTLIEAEARSALEGLAFSFLQKYARADRRITKTNSEQETSAIILQMTLSGSSSRTIAHTLGMTEYYVSQHLQEAISGLEKPK